MKPYTRNMDKLTIKSTYLGLLMPLLFCGKIVIGLQHEVDGVVSVGGNNCDGPIDIPYKIFNHTTLYVSSKSDNQVTDQ